MHSHTEMEQVEPKIPLAPQAKAEKCVDNEDFVGK
jgi:hypothetical protein